MSVVIIRFVRPQGLLGGEITIVDVIKKNFAKDKKAERG